MSSEISLRPHHGLCLGFFEGRGYSGAFSRNMAAVLASLTARSPIRLTSGHDVLCGSCPNRTKACENAGAYDRRVLALCGLTAGQSLTWGELRQAVQTGILAADRLSQVCGGCPWADICQRKLTEQRREPAEKN